MTPRYPRLRLWQTALTLFQLFCVFPNLATAKTVNFTIDDQFGDSVSGSKPTYNPSDFFISNQSVTLGGTPTAPRNAFDGTWTIGSYGNTSTQSAQINLTFNGTAVYVFGILVATTGGFPTNVTTVLDSNPPVIFEFNPPTNLVGANFQFNASVYTNTSIPSGNHQLVIFLQADSNNQETQFLFDYVTYSQEVADDSSSAAPGPTGSPPPPSQSSSTPTGAIVGGVVAAVVVVAVAGYIGYRCYQRQAVRRNAEAITRATDGDFVLDDPRRAEMGETYQSTPFGAYGPSGPSDITSSGGDSDTRALATTRFMRVNGPLPSDNSSVRESTAVDVLQDQVENVRREMEALREQRRAQDEEQLPAYSAV